jgi:hypothetical protein
VTKFKKTLTGAAAVLALATGGGVLASPASATEVGVGGPNGSRGSYDNNPGNGAQSWVWLFGGNGNHGAAIKCKFTDGTWSGKSPNVYPNIELGARRQQTISINFTKNISYCSIRVWN